tara:strand:+ start:495 stop:782 length:288 start_codon:yes stop_codon:yes gene_type:complete
MSNIEININQVTEAAKLLAEAERLPVSKAAKYIHQFNPIAFDYVFKVVGGDKEEMQQWFHHQRQVKKAEWDVRPQIQNRIAVRQQRARILTALSE